MSKNFSANQYEQAYRASRLSTWETGPGGLRKDNCSENRPKARCGPTCPITDKNGHFLDPKFRGTRESAWLNFRGSWELPRRISLHPSMLTTTAMKPERAEKNRKAYEESLKQVFPDFRRTH